MKKEIYIYLRIIVIALVVAIVLNRFIIINATITSESMEPSLYKGDKVIGKRLGYLITEPKRGDVIIFRYPDNEEELLVKRIIGMPTEVVSIVNGKVMITNSEGTVVLEEDYVVPMSEEDLAKQNFGPYVVPDGCYFMLGDNRANSEDSRFWKHRFVTKDKIVAKVWFRYHKAGK